MEVKQSTPPDEVENGEQKQEDAAASIREVPAPAAFSAESLYPLIPGGDPFLYEPTDPNEAGNVGLLLLHGFTATPFEMRSLARYLAERGISVGAALLAGHGTAPEDLQATTWLDWAKTVNNALDWMLAHYKRVYLGGLSLGGALTLHLAAERGSELAGIITMGAPIYIPSPLGFMLRGLQGPIPYLSKPYRDIEDPAALHQHVSYERSPSSSTASLIEFVTMVRSELHRVTVPALVIYARHDHVVPYVNSHHIYSSLASHEKRLVALHRGFHIMTVDTDRERVREAIWDFISEREKLLLKPLASDMIGIERESA